MSIHHRRRAYRALRPEGFDEVLAYLPAAMNAFLEKEGREPVTWDRRMTRYYRHRWHQITRETAAEEIFRMPIEDVLRLNVFHEFRHIFGASDTEIHSSRDLIIIAALEARRASMRESAGVSH